MHAVRRDHSGLGLGSMYGLLALGFHDLRRVEDGELRAGQHHDAGRGAVLHVLGHVRWPLPPAVVLRWLLCALWGVFVERFAVRPFVRRGSNAWLMATVALGIVLDNVGAVHFRQGAARHAAWLSDHGDGSRSRASRFSRCRSRSLWSALRLPPACSVLLQRTAHGKALLAVVQNSDAARLMGIDVERVIDAAFALSGLLAGIAGILVAPLFTISSTMGTLFGIKAFAVAILGGIGSAWGVVLAGLIYGLAEALITACSARSTRRSSPSRSSSLALTLRPNGLFGRARGEEGMSALECCSLPRSPSPPSAALICARQQLSALPAVTVGLTAIVGVGLNVLLGLSGQISLGHVGFYAHRRLRGRHPDDQDRHGLLAGAAACAA